MTKSPPKGFLRWFLRAPIWFYRNGLGWIFGKRFLMFTHIGRKTGRRIDTVVEVVYHDSETDRYFIASGWGEKAQWLQNLAVNPEIDVIVGRQKFHATTTRLHKDSGSEALLAYATKYPLAFKKLSQVMTGAELTADLAGVETLAMHVPIIAVDPVEKKSD